MLLAPTAWRRKFFVPRVGEIGPRVGCSSCLAAAREVQAIAIGPQRSVEKGPEDTLPAREPEALPRLRASMFEPQAATGRVLLALRRRIARCRCSQACSARRGRSRRLLLPEGADAELFSTSGPQGPRRRLRGRVPGNTGRRAGGGRGARAQEQVQVGPRCGARIAR